mgnify:CR=1 FL=1
MLLHSGFELLLCVSCVHFSCVVAFDLQTAVEFLHMLLWPKAPFPPVLQLQGGGSKHWEVALTVSFLDGSP